MQKEFSNKQEFIMFLLDELNKKFAPIKFGEFFIEISPSFGIDNFRNLLEELHQQDLLTKISEPGEFIQSIGMRAVDLRYGISLKGIEYLKSSAILSESKMANFKSIDQTSEAIISVFVTYSWDSEEHNEKAIAFTNFLRDNGFYAEIDKMIIQDESAKDFKIMMHKGMTDFKKVIVILSAGYKEKAEAFKGGVGNEYLLILKDIEENPNKYILISFEGFKNEIVPLFFKSREIIDLSEDNENERQKLFAKLLDKKQYEFSDVATTLPDVGVRKIVSLFEAKQDAIENIKLNFKQGVVSYFARLINFIDLEVSLTFKNNSSVVLSDYTIEIYYPKNTVSFEVDGRIEGEYKVLTIEDSGRVFSQQTKSINLEKVIIRDYTIKDLINKDFKIKIYTSNGNFQESYEVKKIIITDIDGKEQAISIGLFNIK